MTDDSTPFDVVVVGSLNLDLVAVAERHPSPGETVTGTSYDEYPGGKGLNQAVAAARSGARVAMVGCVGDDAAGEHLRSVVDAEGIDASGLITSTVAPTGRALITVDADGENTIVVVSGANALVEPAVAVPPTRVLLTQLEIPTATATAVCRRARAEGAVTLLDPAPAMPLPDPLIAACVAIVPNEHEIEVAGGARHLLARGAGRIIVTRGGDGVEVVERSHSFRHDVFPVDVVDTTGAGDAFRGALAARLATADDIATAIRYATAAGALATTRAGAVPSLPRRADVEALLDRVG